MYKVLLVDDEPVILKGLEIVVDREGYGLEITGVASNGLEAFEIIRNRYVSFKFQRPLIFITFRNNSAPLEAPHLKIPAD